jgi:hypothetical protein
MPSSPLTGLGLQEFGNPNHLPLDVWFEGLTPDRELIFNDSNDKPHRLKASDSRILSGYFRSAF